MKTVLITGATGYVGKHLVDAYLKHGDRVVACARTPEDLDRLSTTHASPRLATHRLDVTDAAAVSETVARCRPDVIISASAFPRRKTGDNAGAEVPFEQTPLYRLNVEGSHNLAKAAAGAGRPVHLVFISSGAAFDQSLKKVDLDSPRDMTSPFARSKNLAERVIEETVRSAPEVKTSIVYPPVILDETQAKGIIPSSAEKALQGKVIENNALPDASMNFLRADDFTRLMLAVTDRQQEPFARYPVNGYRIPTRDLLTKVAHAVTKLTGKRVSVVQGRETASGMPEADETRIRALMGEPSWHDIDAPLNAIVSRTIAAAAARDARTP